MPLEIACDESGSEGEKLIGGQTGVFAHAGVRLSLEEAAACLVELRRRIRSPAVEYKANHLLRTKHRRVLEWFLGPLGPVHGRAHVHLVDKKLLLANELRELIGQEVAPDDALLAVFNDVLRTRNRRDPAAGSFFAMVGDTEELRAKVAELRDAKVLDPLVPAILRAVEHWSGDGEPVFVVHDEQPSLKGERLAEIRSSPGLAGLKFVDSRTDPRVQVADFLAGVARRIAEDELDGRGDEVLTALLAPYIDSKSLWA
ncbi:DUF3800 domain-containing protein [Amycolatopsis regifaucium]|uniref:NAD-dependent protein deacetylase of SIR2 family n=1 Tax=Amycolatopsis regifaucium TaxID=546365 RepID=A0A154MS46_9PSEU|nr:DUF3800 domain-containing protein [Amycolatopsis regifaucium]KZB87158.1 NAD-dependent protein deacetylase of SIR2 family [Amycolatopsis regifaucium]OKA07988.1 NAD-dependent protein deacetylase of SIR2 family [Amycolatopsis regifaucium]SFI35482.1 Protein of unknown function [Amycolatopsis regifaucium]